MAQNGNLGLLWSRRSGAYRAVNIGDKPKGRPLEKLLKQIQMVNGIGHNLNLAGGIAGVNLLGLMWNRVIMAISFLR
jgi:hypothetical protein